MASPAFASSPLASREWQVWSPESVGLDLAKLEAATEAVRRIEQRYGLLIVKDGAIVHEAYFEGSAETRHKVFSITKGFGASLVGIAQTKGLLNVKDKSPTGCRSIIRTSRPARPSNIFWR